MAKIPIEIFNFSENFNEEVQNAVTKANKLQTEIEYSLITTVDESEFNILVPDEIDARFLFKRMDHVRTKIGGFHPYLLLITDDPIYDEYYNIFGSSEPEIGLGVFTTNSVSETIIPKDKMQAYFIYYLARYTLNFLNPQHKNHKATRGCVFDIKTSKLDIKKSMKSDAFCKDCRKFLLTGKSKITVNILSAINNLLAETGNILNDVKLPKVNEERTSIFLSYSHKDEIWKDRLKIHLKPLEELANIEIWSDDQLTAGDKWFEEIHKGMIKSKIGILLISPDFLASDFINHVEIPQLLSNMQNEGGLIIPIILRHSLFPRIKKLSQFQATNSPKNPIAGLSASDQDEIFVKISETIWDLMEKR